MDDDATPLAENLTGAEVSEASVDERVERIDRYIAEAMQCGDTPQACLGAATGDLLHIQYELAEAVRDELEDVKAAERLLADVLPAVKAVTQVSQQVDRYQHTLHKLQAAKAGN